MAAPGQLSLEKTKRIPYVLGLIRVRGVPARGYFSPGRVSAGGGVQNAAFSVARSAGVWGGRVVGTVAVWSGRLAGVLEPVGSEQIAVSGEKKKNLSLIRVRGVPARGYFIPGRV